MNPEPLTWRRPNRWDSASIGGPVEDPAPPAHVCEARDTSGGGLGTARGEGWNSTVTHRPSLVLDCTVTRGTTSHSRPLGRAGPTHAQQRD